MELKHSSSLWSGIWHWDTYCVWVTGIRYWDVRYWDSKWDSVLVIQYSDSVFNTRYWIWRIPNVELYKYRILDFFEYLMWGFGIGFQNWDSVLEFDENTEYEGNVNIEGEEEKNNTEFWFGIKDRYLRYIWSELSSSLGYRMCSYQKFSKTEQN